VNQDHRPDTAATDGEAEAVKRAAEQIVAELISA
jgi:hypothetical protein